MHLLDKTFVIIIISTITSFSTTVEIGEKPELFTTDKLGNCYVYVNGELQKFSNEGKRIADFVDYTFGSIHSIDASDPLRILLFYKGSNTLQFLDNKMNQLGESINLDQLGYFSVTALCKSKDNAVWLYDSFNDKIIKYGFNPAGELKVIHLSEFDEEIQFDYLFEDGYNLFFISKKNIIWIYDLFSEVFSKVEIKTSSIPQITAEFIYFHNNKRLIKHEIETGKTDSISINGITNFEDIQYSAGQYYILKYLENE